MAADTAPKSDDDKARDAQRNEIKALVKEALGEYADEAAKTRTNTKPKVGGGFFDSLFA